MFFIILLLLQTPDVSAAEDTPVFSELVEVEIVTIEGFGVIGMDYTGSDAEEVMALWEEFTPRIKEIPGVNMDDDAFGVLFGYDVISGEYSYLACVESDMEGALPEGMMELSVAGGEYAVFTFPFTLLGEIYNYAYYEWLPESTHSHGDSYDFEYYPAEFIPSEEHVLMQLFISVEQTAR